MYQWSNISGKYLRDVKDWQRLCVLCHSKYDRATIKNLKIPCVVCSAALPDKKL